LPSSQTLVPTSIMNLREKVLYRAAIEKKPVVFAKIA
jgi:hypothetical protein